jgi:hypothetical protein
MTPDQAIEILKLLTPIAVSYIALLKTRTDLDRYIASQRAKESGKPYASQIRHKWYHRLWSVRKPPRLDAAHQPKDDEHQDQVDAVAVVGEGRDRHRSQEAQEPQHDEHDEDGLKHQ